MMVPKFFIMNLEEYIPNYLGHWYLFVNIVDPDWWSVIRFYD